ncbi:jg1083 [Pararge aegeria aegeria]|uniref:Jg1083 protein n=1 Tax=Pararge aegeria aegeria TaxID=348720 RepID=A0A8S4QV99_9NEOP|nr:jg1083 [Pararge aegeria aegeria]
MIVSASAYVSSFGQLSAEAFSYHDLVYLSYNVRPPKLKPTTVMRRSFHKFSNDHFLRDLNCIDWDVVFNAPSLDEKISIFNSLLIELFDTHAPFRPIKLKHLPAPWLTHDIKLAMSKRNAAKSRYKIQPSDANLLKYKRLRNRCNKMCRDAQRNYIHSSVDGKSTLKVWKFLETLGIGRRQKSVPDSVDIDALNRHFSNVTTSISRKTETLASISSRSKPHFPLFQFSVVSPGEIIKHINAVKSDALGNDGISRKMILLSLDYILHVLCYLFNLSLSSSSFPSAWRIAEVIPIPKNSNPSLFSHFRPISILPFLSKVLERIVNSQLSLFLSKNNILSTFQSGFRRGHSTVTALTNVCDDIRLGIDNKQVTILALLDFSNAFNTVDFEILLAILDSINISSPVVRWFHSYLHDRTQCIRVKDKFSSYCRLLAGVPQGGVLSPLLFSIFINTIQFKKKNSKFIYFAKILQTLNDTLKAREDAKFVPLKVRDLISNFSSEEKKDEFLNGIQKSYKCCRDY